MPILNILPVLKESALTDVSQESRPCGQRSSSQRLLCIHDIPEIISRPPTRSRTTAEKVQKRAPEMSKTHMYLQRRKLESLKSLLAASSTVSLRNQPRQSTSANSFLAS
ncbi:hypothetical protein C2857_004520 [Epichloe festucae Fl1]|uniref:Uncharacterized protein n=1 Tax=Epichloe festucae (strain Fl1) TaxID=877507 RepID=A0A7S9KV43_EPIFF|nr:hypothetical protein C2857_004520 [Epichloe festucae Fl1]